MGNLQTKIAVSLKGFREKLKLIAAVSNRTFPDELNKQMLQLVIGAKGSKGLVQLTQKATEARIRADMDRPVTYRLPGGKSITGPLVRVLAAQWLKRQGAHINKAAIDTAAQKIINRRVHFRRAYIAASWLFSAQQLARSVKNSTLTRLSDSDIPQIQGGKAKDSAGKTIAAVPRSLRTVVFNTAIGADKIAQKAIPRALSNAAKDMGKYIAKKWGENYAKKNQ
jgi:hypothetical protein